MLNQMASTSAEPKMYSATYVENYLDSVENLPNDVQRYLTRIREIDLQCRGEFSLLIFTFSCFEYLIFFILLLNVCFVL